MNVRHDPAADPYEWIRYAEDDLRTARYLMRLGAECPYHIVAFHAQQCGEKYLKALLVASGIAPPKVHDLSQLVLLLPQGVLRGVGKLETALLTPYAARARYPTAEARHDRARARRTINAAVKIKHAVQRALKSNAGT